MIGFFMYESPYRTGHFANLSLAEYVIPFFVLGFLLFILFYYRDILRQNERLRKTIQYTSGTIFLILYSSHYLLRFNLYGFDTIILPFQLCSISMFFAIILLFTKQRSIYTFVLFTGVLGGIISLFTPVMGYNSMFYRYYQFYGAHILLIVTPIYFMIAEGYFPTKRETVYAFGILQSLAIFMGFFNYFMNTDFMFIFVDPAKIVKFPAIGLFGGIPWYLILVEITGIIAFYLLYQVTSFIQHKQLNEIEYKKA